MNKKVAAPVWYRCSRSGPGLCYWDGPKSALAGLNRNRCPVCLAPAVEVKQQTTKGMETK